MLPKHNGGLGIRPIRIMNNASKAKMQHRQKDITKNIYSVEKLQFFHGVGIWKSFLGQ